jgi:DNA adenine methylase
MKYMGSKARIAKELVRIILPKGYTGVYIEPFAGGMNMMQAVPADLHRFANDSNKFIIAMFKALAEGWVPPTHVTREHYYQCKRGECDEHMQGYVGINCSYSGKWFAGYAGITVTKSGVRDYQAEAYRHVLKQMEYLTGVTYSSLDYRELAIPDNSIVYCDAPYAGVSGYSAKFDILAFWDWVRKVSEHSSVYVSEYAAPDDFECLWSKELRSSLSANGVSGDSRVSVEKLFTYRKTK